VVALSFPYGFSQVRRDEHLHVLTDQIFTFVASHGTQETVDVVNDAASIVQRRSFGQGFEKAIPRGGMRGQNVVEKRFPRCGTLRGAWWPSGLLSARGRRSFGEIGHENTVGGPSLLIVNRFSTMGQHLSKISPG
jgi:hypothetical protein